MKDATYTLPEQQESAMINREDLGPSKDEALAGKSKYDQAEGFLKTSPTSAPKVASAAIPEYRTKLLQFASTANELLEFFIPADYSNAVIGRYYGSVKRIVNVRIRFARLSTTTDCVYRLSKDFKNTTKLHGYIQIRALSLSSKTSAMI